MKENRSQDQVFHLVYQDIYFQSDHHTIVVAGSEKEAEDKAKNHLNFKGVNKATLEILTEEAYQAKYKNKPPFYIYYLLHERRQFCRIFASNKEDARQILLHRFSFTSIEISQALDQEEFNNRGRSRPYLLPPISAHPVAVGAA